MLTTTSAPSGRISTVPSVPVATSFCRATFSREAPMAGAKATVSQNQ